MLDGPVKSGNREDEAVGGSAGRDLLCNTEPYKWVRENTFIWRLPASLDIGSCNVVAFLSGLHYRYPGGLHELEHNQ
jgi:hypothetical protein